MLLTIFVAFQFKGDKSGLLHEKVHMHISNNLTNGESYNFVFTPGTLIETTLYFCGFRFNTKFHYFVVYDQ